MSFGSGIGKITFWVMQFIMAILIAVVAGGGIFAYDYFIVSPLRSDLAEQKTLVGEYEEVRPRRSQNWLPGSKAWRMMWVLSGGY